jgi:hypothetical protein
LEWHLRKLGQNVFMQTAAWLVSRELTEAAGPWDTRMLADDDGEYFSRVMMVSDGVKFVPEATVFWRNVGPARLSYLGGSREKVRAHLASMELQMARLRSLEESERVREACRRYLRSFMCFAYPEHTEVLERMEKLFQELGGKMEVPSLGWKYSAAEKAFGRALAKRLSFWLRNVRWDLVRRWDKAMLRWERPRMAASRVNAGPPAAWA